MASIALGSLGLHKISVPASWTAHAGPILIAATLAIGFTHDSFLSWQFKAWLGLLVASAFYVWWNHRELDRREKWALGILLGSMLLSIPGSVLWGDWQVTLMVVGWTALPAFLFAIKAPGRVLVWLTPFLVGHALVLAAQGLAGGELRATGLTINPNPATALLLVGIILAICWQHRHWWVLALPFAAALPYTGSRWALVTLALILAGMVLSRYRWRAVIVGALVLGSLALAWGLNSDLVERNYRLRGRVETHTYDAAHRINHGITWGWQDLVGRGYVVPRTGGLHNVPLRLMAQFGVLAALAWLFLVGLRLWEWRRGGLAFWLVLAVLTLSMMDYYWLMGQLGPMGWLLLGWRRLQL